MLLDETYLLLLLAVCAAAAGQSIEADDANTIITLRADQDVTIVLGDAPPVSFKDLVDTVATLKASVAKLTTDVDAANTTATKAAANIGSMQCVRPPPPPPPPCSMFAVT